MRLTIAALRIIFALAGCSEALPPPSQPATAIEGTIRPPFVR